MIVGITGLKRSGKTFLTNAMAETLSDNGNRVGIVDISSSRDLHHIYKSKRDGALNGGITFNPDDSISFSNIDIYTSAAFVADESYFNALNENISILNTKYDVLFLDLDLEHVVNINLEVIDSMNIVIDQRFLDKCSSEKIGNMLEIPDAKLILNRYFDTRFDSEKVLEQFGMSTPEEREKVSIIDYEQDNEEVFQNNFFKNKGIGRYSKSLKAQVQNLAFRYIDAGNIKAKKKKFLGIF